MTQNDSQAITSVLKEERVFLPPVGFSESVGGAHVASLAEYEAMHRRSLDDPDGFWGEVAQELDWFEPWSKVVEWDLPDAKWFVGGKTNLCHNAVDRQVENGHGDELAILWEGEPVEGGAPEVRRLTYADLQRETSKFANALKAQGVKQGDVVTIYMGMVPELAIAVLACARIGAAHSVIFGGFSSQAIADRVEDAQSTIVITCDGSYRRGSVIPLKQNVDDATTLTALIETVVVVRRCQNEVAMTSGRDHWWHELVEPASADCPCAPLDSETMSFLLYTSGSTGKPKGIVHTTGG